MTHINAGQPAGLVFNAQGRLKVRLESQIPPLGVHDESRLQVFKSRTVDLGEGDLVLLFTDGLVDIVGRDGTSFDEQRVAEAISSHGSRTAKDIVLGLRQTLLEFAPSHQLHDDVTIVAVRIK
jgi:serine phosphatase RsbU (regulator of sigma subunit)